MSDFEIKQANRPGPEGPMSDRKVTRKVVWHCSADPEGSGKGPDDVWRTHVDHNGWSSWGYHYVITEDGTIWACRDEGKIGAHVAGENSDSIGIAYIGGMNRDYTEPKDTRTAAQTESLYMLTDHLLAKYGLDYDDVYGHNQFAAKACPSFDVLDDIAAHQGGGDPEPDMPDNGPMGQVIADLLKRVEALEKWRKS